MARTLLALVVVLVLLVGAGAAAVLGGYAPMPDGENPLAGGATEDGGSFPTATATPDGGGGGGGSDGTSSSGTATTATQVSQPFTVVIDSIEECGTTCRDVTVSLTNRQDVAAEDVEVYTRIFAGNSTDESDRIWRGQESVGRLAAGETYTGTKRVELSYSEGYAVRQADGWVTVQTTIQTADQTVTFNERRNVN